jgi:hypothetical protein
VRRLTPTRSVAAGSVVALAVLAAAPAYGDGPISLPEPAAARAQELALVCNKAVGATPERCKKSSVPGPVVNDEKVLIGLGGDGVPVRVLLEQRLVLTKVGDYVIRERGPARSAVGLVPDSDPPNTKLGAVVYQGFTPGNRRLGARLTLDAGLEAPRLPLTVTVTFDDGRGARALDPGGRVPGPGTVQVRLTNNTAQPAVLPTGSDANPASLAPALDAALRAARAPAGPRLPSTDTVLPKTLDVASPARREASQSVPLRISGSLRVTGTTGSVSGDGASPVPNGAVVAGTLSAELHTVQVTAQVNGPGVVRLDLTAVPALDARVLAPPRGFATWTAWARSRPPQPERQAALDLVVTTAATGARASSYSPYLGADLPGSGTTVFSYAFAPADAAAVTRARLHPKPGPIALAGIALLLLLVNGGLIWRQS